jgi:hypothetical protein
MDQMLMLLVFIAIVAVVYFIYQREPAPARVSGETLVTGQGECEEIGGDISEHARDNVEQPLMDL